MSWPEWSIQKFKNIQKNPKEFKFWVVQCIENILANFPKKLMI